MDKYHYIVNPLTNRKCRIDTQLGRKIIKGYAQVGGSCFFKKGEEKKECEKNAAIEKAIQKMRDIYTAVSVKDHETEDGWIVIRAFDHNSEPLFLKIKFAPKHNIYERDYVELTEEEREQLPIDNKYIGYKGCPKNCSQNIKVDIDNKLYYEGYKDPITIIPPKAKMDGATLYVDEKNGTDVKLRLSFWLGKTYETIDYKVDTNTSVSSARKSMGKKKGKGVGKILAEQLKDGADYWFMRNKYATDFDYQNLDEYKEQQAKQKEKIKKKLAAGVAKIKQLPIQRGHIQRSTSSDDLLDDIPFKEQCKKIYPGWMMDEWTQAKRKDAIDKKKKELERWQSVYDKKQEMMDAFKDACLEEGEHGWVVKEKL